MGKSSKIWSTVINNGSAPVDTGATIIPFPGSHATNVEISQGGGKVKTINELESMAIENAIFEYNGNLTETAKALGIGRATLYRKVKQYSIDPSAARKNVQLKTRSTILKLKTRLCVPGFFQSRNILHCSVKEP